MNRKSLSMGDFVYPLEILHLYVSDGHSYFGQNREKRPADCPVRDEEGVELVTGKGIRGDRFYDVREGFDGQVTFFSAEALPEGRFDQLRRNVVTRGVAVTELIGQTFSIRQSGISVIRFFGVKHCAPCVWLDKVMGEGTMRRLAGRGGLRARVLSDGRLRRGEAEVVSPIELDVDNPAKALPRPILP